MGIRCGGLGVCAALAVGFTGASGISADEIVGKKDVTLQWSPASGPVAGYYVIVARDGSSAIDSVSRDTQQTVSGEYGETLFVQIAAFDANGVAGPLSPPSNALTFLPPEAPPAPEPGGSADGGGASGGSGEEGAGEPDPPADSGPLARLDFTGDGWSDLLVREGGHVSLWATRGSHVTDVLPLPDVSTGMEAVATGDFDGNGVADVVWEEPSTRKLTVWLLEDGRVTATAALDRSGLEEADSWRVGGSGDFDADGRDELLLFSRVVGAAETWSLDDNAGIQRSRHPGHTGAWSVAAVVDVDGDARAEIVWLDERTRELRLDAAGSSASVAALEAGWKVAGSGDLDGDGRSELLLQHPASGALEAWTLDASGQVSAARSLPNPDVSSAELFAGGDFDADAREDLVWSDPTSGTVTLWFSTAQGEVAAALDRGLPKDGALIGGAGGSDDTAFRERFCSGDLDGNGRVDRADFRILRGCYWGTDAGDCERADLDGDGQVTRRDGSILRDRYRGGSCEIPL